MLNLSRFSLLLRQLSPLRVFLALWLGLTPSFVSAQGMLLLGVGGGSVAAYQGPGDVQSGAVAFYSCRAYTAAKAGTKAYRLIRASDSTQTDINSLPNGLCDTSTPTTFCSATTCKYVTWYDQSGANNCTSAACDLTQATGANQPTWTASSLNGWPCAVAAASSGIWLQSANNVTSTSIPYAFVAVYQFPSTPATAGRLFVAGNITAGFSESSGNDQMRFTAGSTIISAGTQSLHGVFHSVIGIGNSGATGSIQIDTNAATTGTTGTNTISAVPILAFNDTSHGTSGFQGTFCEAGIWPSAGSFPSSSMTTNLHSASIGWNF